VRLSAALLRSRRVPATMHTPYRPAMPDTPNLHPATRDELTQSLSFALRFNGRKRARSADELMAQITVERLVERFGAGGIRGRAQAAAGPARGAGESGRLDREGDEVGPGRVASLLRSDQSLSNANPPAIRVRHHPTRANRL
jgi:hypothetical protein